MYRTLQPEKIVETAESLATRVKERFPESGLWKVAAEVAEVARKAQGRCAEIRRPHLPLRILIAGLVALAAGDRLDGNRDPAPRGQVGPPSPEVREPAP